MNVGRFAARVGIAGLFIGHGTQKLYWLVRRARGTLTQNRTNRQYST